MKKKCIWFLELLAFLAVCALFDQVPWRKLLSYAKDGAAVAADRVLSTQGRGSDSGVTEQTRTGSDTSEHRTSTNSPDVRDWFPEDATETQREYRMAGEGLPPLFQKLRMLMHVDGITTLNGRRYYKVVLEYSGAEDLVALLTNPDAPADEVELLKSRQVTEFVKSLQPSIAYERRDDTGIYSLDGNDLDKPESRDPPFPITVGTKWSADDLRYTVTGFEDVEAADRTFRNCIKVQASSNAAGADIASTIYSAPGIGVVKISLSNKLSWILESYRR